MQGPYENKKICTGNNRRCWRSCNSKKEICKMAAHLVASHVSKVLMLIDSMFRMINNTHDNKQKGSNADIHGDRFIFDNLVNWSLIGLSSNTVRLLQYVLYESYTIKSESVLKKVKLEGSTRKTKERGIVSLIKYINRTRFTLIHPALAVWRSTILE